MPKAPATRSRNSTIGCVGSVIFTLLRISGVGLAAAHAFQAVTGAKDVPAEWRRQAFTQLGDVHRRSGDLSAAIAAWREALRTPPTSGQDTIWFARAGFDAAQALQDLKLWREAAAVYQQIGEAGGFLRTEAEARLTQLRLAHFLWPQGTSP